MVKDVGTESIKIKGNAIYFRSLTLKQKLSQMILVRGDRYNKKHLDLNLGGVFLNKLKFPEKYKKVIKKYKDNSKVRLFIATDFEGLWTPFITKKYAEKFPKFLDIKTKEEAYEVGVEQGKIMKKIGFNLNFSPVAEYIDDVYGGRVFVGAKKEIKNKIRFYIRGLQENVFGTCKHYPGKSMLKNLHKVSHKQKITKENLELFEVCKKEDVSSIIIGHQKVYGKIFSNDKPSTVSKSVIDSLNHFKGLIISDEVSMKGLKKFYIKKKKMYIDLINSGENLILDFYSSIKELHELLNGLELEVKNGKINEEKINKSVKKILKMKGYRVLD